MAILTDKPVLYSFRRCPYAIRARLAIYSAKIDCELREVVLKNKPQEMLDVSAKGTVPVLVLEDLVIDESLDIMHWALTLADPQKLIVDTLKNELVARNDDFFKKYLDCYKYHDRYPETTQQESLQKACEFIAELENRLTSGEQPGFLNGKGLSALDLAILPFIRQFAFVDKHQFDNLPYPAVQQWLAKFLDSDLFNAVMLKYPPWQPNQEPLIFQNENEREVN